MHTPGPYHPTYTDTLPNGLRVIRIDSAQPVGVSVVAFLPLGLDVDGEIDAIQDANARLLSSAPALLDMVYELRELVNREASLRGLAVCAAADALLAAVEGTEATG